MTDTLMPSHLLAGTVIAVRYPIYKHFAIVSDIYGQEDHARRPNLISLSYRTGGVREESWQRVVGNRPVEISTIQGSLTRKEVLARARMSIEENINYNLLNYNCEHFVRYAHGLPIKSIQVNQTFKGAAVGAVSCILMPNLTISRLAMITTVGALTALKSSLDQI